MTNTPQEIRARELRADLTKIGYESPGLFSREGWTFKKAKAWGSEHGFPYCFVVKTSQLIKNMIERGDERPYKKWTFIISIEEDVEDSTFFMLFTDEVDAIFAKMLM